VVHVRVTTRSFSVTCDPPFMPRLPQSACNTLKIASLSIKACKAGADLNSSLLVAGQSTFWLNIFAPELNGRSIAVKCTSSADNRCLYLILWPWIFENLMTGRCAGSAAASMIRNIVNFFNLFTYNIWYLCLRYQSLKMQTKIKNFSTQRLVIVLVL